MVATAPYTICSKTLEAFKIPLKSPKINPKIVLNNAFNPRGAALKKSSIIPDIKPVLSANKDPLFNAMYMVTNNKKSGITGKKVKLETTAVSKSKKQNIARIVEKNDLNISTPAHFLYQQS